MALDKRQHIQNFSDASNLEPHWGYAGRVIPCTNDAGSCAYLDLVYWAHDIGMLYVGIMWAIIAGGLLLWAFIHRSKLSSSRLFATLAAARRRFLLTELRATRWIFGRTTKLQIVVLGIISAYLFVFSFAGMTYNIWITPVKNMPGVNNTRTTLGPWSDRVGVLAYALTPLSIMLAQRESLLATLTGIPYHHFNFLHRWLGHIIFAQSALHTIGWTIIEVRLYQPQPSVAVNWIKQTYMIWGVVAMLVLLILWGLALPISQRVFGYEFFRKAHWILAMVYIGAAIGHWEPLSCFLIPSILLWFVDRAARLVRTGLLHYRVMPDGNGMFASIPTKVTHFGDDVVRLDVVDPNPNPAVNDWLVGQHFYLTFPALSIWQSHPFTPLSLPGTRHSYIIRAKRGESRKLVNLDLCPRVGASSPAIPNTTPLILTGPYGGDALAGLDAHTDVLAIAGGTGISFVLPVLLRLALVQSTGRVKLIWVIRRAEDRAWVAPELEVLRKSGNNIEVVIHTTREEGAGASALPEYIGSGDAGAASCHSTEASGSGSGSASGAATPSVDELKSCHAPAPASFATAAGKAKQLEAESSSDCEKHSHPHDNAEHGRHHSHSHVHHRPDIHAAIDSFIRPRKPCGAVVRTSVFVSGPSGIITAARESVARLNDPGRVWRGEGGEVALVYDERLE